MTTAKQDKCELLTVVAAMPLKAVVEAVKCEVCGSLHVIVCGVTVYTSYAGEDDKYNLSIDIAVNALRAANLTVLQDSDLWIGCAACDNGKAVK